MMGHERRRRGPRWARRAAFGTVGGAVTLVGLALIPLPGPGLLVILLGLTILSVEFERARHWRQVVSDRARSAMQRVRHRYHDGPERPGGEASPSKSTDVGA